jgi:hypothetical protein
MDQVELRVVKSDTKLKSALTLMQANHRGAVIIEQGRKPIVITRQDVAQELRRRNQDVTLAEIEPRDPTVDASIDFAMQSFEHPATRSALQAALANRNALYAIISITASSARIVTISERIADSLKQSFTICTCRKDDTHVWFPQDLTDPNKCEIDGEPVDCT